MAPLIVKTEVSRPDGTTTVKAGLSLGAIIVAALGGALIALAGVAFDAIDVYFAVQAKQAPHLTHLAIGLAVFVTGIVVAFGHYVINPLYQVTVLLNNTSLPIIGGRRAGDPQLPPPGEGGKP